MTMPACRAASKTVQLAATCNFLLLMVTVGMKSISSSEIALNCYRNS
jgi:hypothetical protein